MKANTYIYILIFLFALIAVVKSEGQSTVNNMSDRIGSPATRASFNGAVGTGTDSTLGNLSSTNATNTNATGTSTGTGGFTTGAGNFTTGATGNGAFTS